MLTRLNTSQGLGASEEQCQTSCEIEGWYRCSAGWSAGCGLCCTGCIAVNAYARDRERLEGTWLEVIAGYSGESQKSPELKVVPLYHGCKLRGQLGKCLKL